MLLIEHCYISFAVFRSQVIEKGKFIQRHYNNVILKTKIRASNEFLTFGDFWKTSKVENRGGFLKL